MTGNFNHIFKVIFVFTVGLFLTSCSDIDLRKMAGLSDENSRSEITLSLNVSVPNAATRTRSADYDITQDAVIRTCWIGVYDITTGERVGAILSNGENQIPSTSTGATPNGYKVNLLYFDSHPSVAIVGVANFTDVTDYNGISIAELLDNAETWRDFVGINVDLSTINNDTPLLMGVLSNKGNNNNVACSVAANGGVNISNLGSEYIVDLSGGKKIDGIDFNGTMIHTLANKSINLTYLLSQIDVNIFAGEEIEISDISYKRGNMPQCVYLAERPTYTGDAKNLNSFKEGSSNFADTMIEKNGGVASAPLYSSDEEWHPVSAGNSFTFSHYENKHWGWNYKDETADVHKNREAKWDDSEILKSLCNNATTEYNNWAPYFIVKMKVLDKNNHSSAVVEYTIHEGNCNDADGNSSVNSVRDYSCYRNTIYTYNLTVNGLNSLLVNVTGTNFAGEPGTVNNGISGTMFEVDDIVQDSSEEGVFEFTIPANSDNLLFRLYKGNGDSSAPADFLDNRSGNDLSYFDGIYWPSINSNTATEISDDINNSFTFYEGNSEIGNFSKFVDSYSAGKTYKVKFNNLVTNVFANPERWMRGFYFYSADEPASFTRAESAINGVFHRCIWYPAADLKQLPTPTPVAGSSGGNFLTEFVSIELENLPDINTTYYQYKAVVNGKYEHIISGTTLRVPTYELRGDATNTYTLQAISKNNGYVDSEISDTATITVAQNKKWDFNATKWDAVLKEINGKTGDLSGAMVDNLYFINSGESKFTTGSRSDITNSYKNKRYVQVSGGGSTEKVSFKFTVYKSCRIKCVTSTSGTEAANRYLKVEAYRNGEQLFQTEANKHYAGYAPTAPDQVAPVVDIAGITEPTDIYIFSQGSGLRFFEIELVEIPE